MLLLYSWKLPCFIKWTIPFERAFFRHLWCASILPNLFNTKLEGVYTLHTDPHWAPLTPTEPHWAPLTSTEPHWAPTEPYCAPLTITDLHWARKTPLSTPTDPSDLYWAQLTSTESYWAKCSIHLLPLIYIHPSVTHNDSFLSQMNHIWPQIILNNARLSSNCLKRLQPNQLFQLSSMYAIFPSKKATNHALWP